MPVPDGSDYSTGRGRSLSPVATFDVVFLADMPVVLKLLAVVGLALFGVTNAYVTRWAFRSRRRA